MAFVRIEGFPGLVFVPDAAPRARKRHACSDCHFCQGCGEERCRLCRVHPRAGRAPEIRADSGRDGGGEP